MHPRRETTLGGTFELSGIGLHTGGYARVQGYPAESGSGIIFERNLSDGRVISIHARWPARISQPLCTALQASDGTMVRTVEHLLAALAALQIDNVRIKIDAEELPILDGSAAPWCEAIMRAGRVELAAFRSMIRVLQNVEVRDGRRILRLEPSDHFSVSASVVLAKFGAMHWRGVISPECFRRELAPSRSFGRLAWAIPIKLHAKWRGLPILRGAGFSNTATIIGRHVLGGMRVPNEPVRHRVLDLVGDLSLAGHPILGHVEAAHTGHELNHALVAKLMHDPTSWELVR